MKTKILFLLFTSILFSSKTTYGQTGEKNIKARLIICSGLSEKNVPLDDLKEIYLKEGEKVTLYVKWFNLNKKSYVTSMDFLDANGNYLAQSSEYKFKPKKKTHNTWNKRKFRKVIVPEGVIKIRINLDEEMILEREIEIKYKSE
ncbi:hypothetical protein [Lacinutrix sp. MEBiC02595]